MSSLALSTYVSPGNWEYIRQQAEKHESQPAATIESLPEELFLRIFGFLSPEALGGASRVCREWRRLASDQTLWDTFNLKTFYPGFNVIDEKIWEKHVDLKTLGIDATGAPSLDTRTLIPVIHDLSRQVESGAGVTLLTIPKGLTFNKLLKLAKTPKEGNTVRISKDWPDISQRLGGIPVDKTYIVAITNSVLANSRNLSVKDQQQLVSNLGYEMPRVLPAAALAILTYMSSPQEQPPIRLYNDEPWTYTRCLEKIGNYNLTVGGFSFALYPSGLDISCNYYDYFADVNIGVAALRKFEVIDDNSRSL